MRLFKYIKKVFFFFFPPPSFSPLVCLEGLKKQEKDKRKRMGFIALESLKESENSNSLSSVLIARVRSSDTSKIPPVRVGGHLYSLSLGNLTNDLPWLQSYWGTRSLAPSLLQQPEHTPSIGMAQMACPGDKINYNMSPRCCQAWALFLMSEWGWGLWVGIGGPPPALCSSTHHYLLRWQRSGSATRIALPWSACRIRLKLRVTTTGRVLRCLAGCIKWQHSLGIWN